MVRLFIAILAVVSATTSVSFAAQQTPAPAAAATYVSSADLSEVLKKATAGDKPTSDTTARNVPGPNNVAVNIGHRTKAGATLTAGAHANMTEIWYITEGTGTVLTGGSFVNAPPPSAAGDTRGPIQNGVSQRVTVGDVIVIPPGTPHTFSEIETPLLVFLNIRITPGK